MVGSALNLFVLRVLADDHDFSVSLDHLALFADGLDGSSDFHDLSSLFGITTCLSR